MQAKRIMAERGQMETSTSEAIGSCGVKYGMNKVCRGQLGSGLHGMWIRDMIKCCGTKALLICDFAHGAGEIMKACISAKVSEEASSTGVRVCAWGHDPRNNFVEIGRAVGRTELTKLYVQGKLVARGPRAAHQPVPDPGPIPSERSRKLVKASLQRPFNGLQYMFDHPIG
jgi:hypothetical protein